MAYLSFISDDDLKSAVLYILETAQSSLRDIEKKFGKNVIDPFGALFEMPGFGLSKDEWVENEKKRQAQKTLQNHIGTFHQKIIGSVLGWEDRKVGSIVDLVNTEKKIVAEIKNKYNTVTGAKLKDVYDTLHDAVLDKLSKYKGYTAYYVEIIPKKPKPYDQEFTPPDNKTGGKRASNVKIRRIDGQSFYALATGIPDALEQLINVLPQVINDLLGAEKLSREEIAFIKEYFDKAYKEPPSKKQP